MTTLCTQLFGQTGGLGGLYLPTMNQPTYAARFGAGSPSDNIAMNGQPVLVYGAPTITDGSNGVLPSIALNAANSPSQYIDTGVQDTSSISIITIAKAQSVSDLNNTCCIASNFNNDETGTLQFYLNSSGVVGVYSTATSGLNNQSSGVSLSTSETTEWGLYSIRINTTSSSTTLYVDALTAGKKSTISTIPRYVPTTGAKTIEMGYTPAKFFNGALSISEPMMFSYALSDSELDGVAKTIRARAAQFNVTI